VEKLQEKMNRGERVLRSRKAIGLMFKEHEFQAAAQTATSKNPLGNRTTLNFSALF